MRLEAEPDFTEFVIWPWPLPVVIAHFTLENRSMHRIWRADTGR